jgi:hypothetical protein
MQRRSVTKAKDMITNSRYSTQVEMVGKTL